MQRAFSWLGRFDVINFLTLVAVVMILIGIMAGPPKRKPAPLPNGDVTLVIPPGVVEDSQAPNGYWVDASESGIVTIKHQGDAIVQVKISYWKDGECIEIFSVQPVRPGSELLVTPRLWYCDGIYVKIIKLQ